MLAGHDHNYERFAPQTADRRADPARGIREFVVGTGGATTTPFGAPEPNSEVRNSDTFGVLKLDARPPAATTGSSCPIAGQTFTDSGTGACH